MSSISKIKKTINIAIKTLQQGNGIILVDGKERENECDIVFPAKKMTIKQMAFTIRYGSGIVCLCLTEKHCKQLKLPMMTKKNTSLWQTGFTVSIEGSRGVTTGVSASDRLKTIKLAVNKNAKPSDICYPGHVFPLKAHPKGILKRRGHTEATIKLMELSGYKPPLGVICELTNEDGSMKKKKDANVFAKKFDIPIVMIDDLFYYLYK